MRLGLIARSDPRGLGIQTKAVHDHLAPERTLVVDMGDLGRGYPTHPHWYPDAITLPFDGHRLPEPETRAWLDGLDVIYTAETPYDHRLPTWCREHHVALVVHLNPEFDHWTTDLTKPLPTRFWSATSWRHTHHPEGTRLVPMPIPDGKIASQPRTGDRGLLHVVGRRALADRNGTAIVQRSWAFAGRPQRWTLTTQDRLGHTRPPRRIDLHLSGPVEDRWDLYELGDVLVLPRRYGGLCLPVIEAAARGLAVVMPDVAPNPQWPIIPVPARPSRTVKMPAGQITTHEVNPKHLAALIDHLLNEPGAIPVAAARALAWAGTQTWDRLRPLWLAELEAAADLAA